MPVLTPNPTKTRSRRLNQVIRATLFVALTVALCALFRFLLVDDVHSYTRVTLQEFYAQEGQIDTLFLGSSHCYRAFDPAQIDAELDTHSFNLGSSQQLPDGSYYLLREAAERNPLKTVYLEVFFAGYNQKASSDIPLACYLMTDYMKPTSHNRYEWLWNMGGAAAMADLIFPARHSIAEPQELPALWKAKLTDGYEVGNYTYLTYPGEEEYRGRGYVYTYGVGGAPYDPILHLNEEKPLSDYGWDCLNQIAAYCREQQIELVLVMAPLPNAFAAHTTAYQSYVETLRNFAESHDVEYWDFTLYRNTALLDMQPEDFSDAHHLNGSGAQKFGAAFCQTVRDRAAGRASEDLFFDTLEEKLTTAPDGTWAAAGEENA